jgi:ligand-binding SRPBCC domain-containing protein
MHTRTLHRTTLVARPLDEVFAFFSDPANLELLTPPWLRFRILTPLPIAMREGAEIDYRIALRGLPLRWRSEITAWEPPLRFVDEQRRGPYRIWVHEHRFRALDGGTEIVDRIHYAAWGGRLVERLFVDRDLERIFDYRQQRIAELLAPGGSGRDVLARQE